MRDVKPCPVVVNNHIGFVEKVISLLYHRVETIMVFRVECHLWLVVPLGSKAHYSGVLSDLIDADILIKQCPHISHCWARLQIQGEYLHEETVLPRASASRSSNASA